MVKYRHTRFGYTNYYIMRYNMRAAAILTFDKIMSHIFWSGIFQSCNFDPNFSVLSFRLLFFWSLAFLGPAHFTGDLVSTLHASVKSLTNDNNIKYNIITEGFARDWFP